MNASRVPSGDQAGLLPPAIAIGSPPWDGIFSTCDDASVPRVAAIHAPSGETAGSPWSDVPRVTSDARAPVRSSSSRHRFACWTPRRYTSRWPSADTLQPFAMLNPVSNTDKPVSRTSGAAVGAAPGTTRSRSADSWRWRMT